MGDTVTTMRFYEQIKREKRAKEKWNQKYLTAEQRDLATINNFWGAVGIAPEGTRPVDMFAVNSLELPPFAGCCGCAGQTGACGATGACGICGYCGACGATITICGGCPGNWTYWYCIGAAGGCHPPVAGLYQACCP